MTESQRLARELTAIKRRAGDVIDSDDSDALHKAAAELRRLDEVEGDYQRLLEKHNNLHKNYTAMLAVSEARAAECEQLRADAARLDWIEKGGFAPLPRPMRLMLEDARHDRVNVENFNQAVDALAAYEAAKPVAWRYKYKFRDIGETGAYEYHSHDFACVARLPKGEPLYAAPVPEAATPKPAPAPEADDLQKQLDDALSSLDFYKRRSAALQSCQHMMRDPERTMVCDILANGSLLINGKGKLAAERYAPAQAQHYSTTDGTRCDNCGDTLSMHTGGGRYCAEPVKPAPAPEAALLNGLTEADTSASPSVAGLSAPAQAQQPASLHVAALQAIAALERIDHATEGDRLAAADALRAALKAKPEAQQVETVWVRDQRGDFEGPQAIDPLVILGTVKPPPGLHGATYSPFVAAKPEAQQPLTWELFVAACEAEYGEDFAPEEFMGASDDEKTEIMRVARMVERICAEAWGVKLAGIGEAS